MKRLSGRLAVPSAELYYETDGAGEAVVFVHAFTLDTRMWDDQVPALVDVGTVVRYDVRGFGRSTAPALGVPYSHGEDLLALLDHLDISSALLVGSSMGGLIVLLTALIAPERVRGLVLLDPLLEGVAWDQESGRAMDAVGAAAAEAGVEAAREVWLAHPFFSLARRKPEVAARLAAMVGDYSGFHWTQPDPRRPLSPRPIDALEQVTAATTIVVGEHDVPCFLTMAGILADRIPDARKITIPGAGHMVSMEAPDLVNAALRTAITTSR